MGIYYYDNITGEVRRSVLSEKKAAKLIERGYLGNDAIYFFAEAV